MAATEIGIPEGQIAIAALAHVLIEIAEMTDIVHHLLLTGEVAEVVQVVVVAGVTGVLLRLHWAETDLTLLVEDLLFLLCLPLTVEDGMHHYLIDHIPEADLAVAAEGATMTDATIVLLTQPQGEKEGPLLG